jgi:hypothetical protein
MSTIERVNFILRLSFVPGEYVRQLPRFDIAIHIVIDQHDRADTA